LQIPAGIAIWTPNVLFTLVGVVLLVATAREWYLPARPLLWRVLEALAALAPRQQERRGQLHAPHPTRDSTHIIDRYLGREYLTFLGTGLGVAAVLVVGIDLRPALDRYLRSKAPVPS